MRYWRIPIRKAVIYISPDELHSLLLKDIPLYKMILARSKHLERAESKDRQYEAKFGQHEKQALDEFLQ